MRRRPRPFMLSASTGDGAALVVIVGLLCLPLSAFVALPAMLLTAKLVDSNSYADIGGCKFCRVDCRFVFCQSVGKAFARGKPDSR